jgi:hypothetical protein
MRRFLALILLALPCAAQSTWDSSKPANNSSAVSADVRNGWKALERGMGGRNVVADNDFQIWAAGDTTAPTMWATAGAGLSIARTGAGLGDTSRQYGKFAAKVTSAAVAAQVYQDLITAASFDTGLRGLVMSCGGYVKSSTSSTARIYIYDGTTTTYSSYHSGGGTFTWLTVTAATGVAVTGPLRAGLDVATGTKIGYLQALTCVIGQVPPQYPQLSEWRHGHERFFLSGAQTTGTGKAFWQMFGRAGIFEDVELFLQTVPTGSSFIVDVNTWDGAAFTSMFSARPTIAISGSRANAIPDSTYARRCWVGIHSSSVAAGQAMDFDIDQIGSTIAGSNLTVEVRWKTAVRPLDAILAVGE